MSTSTAPPPTRTVTSEPPTPTLLAPTPTTRATFTVQPGTSLPLDRPLLVYEAGSDQNKMLILADPAENTAYAFSFPAAARFATPFLAGLSPDTRHFVYFAGGWLDTLYDFEHLHCGSR